MKLSDEINVLETNIDDCSGEVLGYTLERLFKAGARDASYSPIFMKKNRPAYKLTVLCDDEHIEVMEDIIFEETTTIGIRRRKEIRTILKRELSEVDTKYGKLGVKIAKLNGKDKVYPEYDCAKKLAEKNSVSLKEIYNQINK